MPIGSDSNDFCPSNFVQKIVAEFAEFLDCNFSQNAKVKRTSLDFAELNANFSCQICRFCAVVRLGRLGRLLQDCAMEDVYALGSLGWLRMRRDEVNRVD